MSQTQRLIERRSYGEQRHTRTQRQVLDRSCTEGGKKRNRLREGKELPELCRVDTYASRASVRANGRVRVRDTVRRGSERLYRASR